MYPSEVDINLNDLILAELSFLDSSLYFKHKIQKNISLDPDLPILHGLYRPISQAIHNIIIHSMKATAELPDKILTINTRQTPVHLVVEISDNRKIRKNEAEYLSKPHFESMYMGIPDEANFSAHDIDVALAAKCLTDASIGFQFFPNNEAKFIIQIQK